MDSSLKKEEKKSDKSAESAHENGVDLVHENEKNQSCRGNMAAGIVQFKVFKPKKYTTLKSVTDV